MVDLCVSSAFGILLVLGLGEGPIINYARPTPQSTPREVAPKALVAAFGLVLLHILGINPFDLTSAEFVPYLGAS